MNKEEFLAQILTIKEVSMATISEDGKPTNRIMDIMYVEEDCPYFLTARGKKVFQELERNPYVSLAVCKESKAYSLSGSVEKADRRYLRILMDRNPFMYEIYPGDAKEILEVFCIKSWRGEFFDLNQRPIYRQSFTNRIKDEEANTYRIIKQKCNGCGLCLTHCPQKCINIQTKEIQKEHCLKCGACKNICTNHAII